MAKKISGLTAASAAAAANEFEINEAGTSKKVTGAQIAAMVRSTVTTFSAYPAANQTGIANATFTKVNMDTENWDVGGYFDTTNKRWTPPAGKVRMSARVSTGAGQSVGTCLLCLYKNGARFRDGSPGYAQTANDGACEGSWLVDANGTDYFEIYIILATGGTAQVNAAAQLTRFEGELL